MTDTFHVIRKQIQNLVELQDRLDEQVKQIHHLIRHDSHCATLMSTIDSTRLQVQELVKGIDELEREIKETR